MADSVDRVFVHALNTVKRIPRLGSARPPPSERLKLYGLYKQSTEGDVDGVMDRPLGESPEARSDQEKWDAWNIQKGTSRTEAKRQYISTLIDTMHRYASQTPDARELVAELEFVWDQVKSNSASDASSHSQSNPAQSPPRNQPSESPPSSSNPPIYPVMSEGGSRNPRAGPEEDERHRKATDDSRLRVLSPISQGHGGKAPDDEDEGENTGEEAELDPENFVDARDSQIADNDRGLSSSSSDREGEADDRPREKDKLRNNAVNAVNAAGAIIAPIAKYMRMQKKDTRRAETPTGDWQLRIENALIRMNAEVAALREQLEMQDQRQETGSVYSSIVHPFRHQSRRHQGFFAWFFESVSDLVATFVKHIIVDIALLAVVTIWMRYRGIPPERLVELISGWIRKIQQLGFFRRVEQQIRHAEPGVVRLPVGGASSLNGRHSHFQERAR